MRPFEVKVTEATLRDLKERLARTRWVGTAADWDAGTSPAYLRSLVEHWRSAYE
jgi:epoxide hydrolase